MKHLRHATGATSKLDGQGLRRRYQTGAHGLFTLPWKALLSGVILSWWLPASADNDAESKTAAEPIHYAVKVLEKKPFDRGNFTQGLEFHEDTLMVSSGLYGQSAVKIYSWPQLELQREWSVPDQFFAEGLTRVGEQLLLLTWRARRLLILDANSLTPLGSTPLPGEGWGITNHANTLYWSDGSHRIMYAELGGSGTIKQLRVTLNGQPVTRLNELEWINGEIWANVWGSNTIVCINPASGVVTAVIDLSGLLATTDRQADTDVLNGIAYNPGTDEIWVTGKRWPWLFRIALESR